MQDRTIFYSSGYKYLLRKDYYFESIICPEKDVCCEFFSWSKTGQVHVYYHYAWDGASGPTIDTCSSMRGSLEHDVGYQLLRLIQAKLIDLDVSYEQLMEWKDIIDKKLHDTCTEDGMFAIRADYWKLGVEWFGERSIEPWSEPEILTAP